MSRRPNEALPPRPPIGNLPPGMPQPRFAQPQQKAQQRAPQSPLPSADLRDEMAKRAKLVEKAQTVGSAPKFEIPTDDLDNDPSLEQPTMQFAQRQSLNEALAGQQQPVRQPPEPMSVRREVLPRAAAGSAFVTDKPPEGFIRVFVPSKCVPYPFDALHARPLMVKDLAAIVSATEASDLSSFLDALSNCVYQNIRDLTLPDFRFLMYWWRINSYPKSPYVLNWTSRYGNRNRIEITNTNLKMKEIELDRAGYNAWRQRGYRFPTMADIEREKVIATDAQTRFLFEKAQYLEVDEPIDGDWMKARILRLSESSMSVMEDIREFAGFANYGVTEEFTGVDENFNPETAPIALRRSADAILNRVNSYMDTADPDLIEKEIAEADKYLEEASAIEKAVAEGQPYEPKEEVIAIRIDTMDFFPSF